MALSKLLFLFVCLCLCSCKQHVSFEETSSIPITLEKFQGEVGYPLAYKIYMPNSYTGWTPNAENEMLYDKACECYQIKNLNISKQQVDSWGSRLKITSKNWQHEFGFSNAHNSIEQSKFGISQAGTYLQIQQIIYAADMYFELPQQHHANYLHARVKVLSKQDQPKALLHVYYSENQLPQ